MFDANMSHLPKGHRFFAEVYTVSDKLKAKGINKGDLILCHMLNSGYENPCVDMLVNGKLLTVSSHQDFCENWFVYTGNADGTGFIKDELKRKAMTQLIS
jgi:hypothetical protein